ncbi:hypothetical protein CsSME_00044421 [Camellia sinensis var. sinensis]
MITFEEKTKIKQAYDRNGDGVIVWADDSTGVTVDFTDLKGLVRQSSVWGNDMVKSADVGGFDKFVRKNISAGTMCRFIHFPMCHNGHRTLVVYDTESGEWKHYNLMRQRTERVDVHYTEALLLKERVTNVMKQSLIELGMDVLSIEADFDHALVAVSRCPQQKAESLDCGIIVCAIMRQYVHHYDVERTLQGSNCSVLRANMVKSFVNDPVRGLI